MLSNTTTPNESISINVSQNTSGDFSKDDFITNQSSLVLVTLPLATRSLGRCIKSGSLRSFIRKGSTWLEP